MVKSQDQKSEQKGPIGQIESFEQSLSEQEDFLTCVCVCVSVTG